MPTTLRTDAGGSWDLPSGAFDHARASVTPGHGGVIALREGARVAGFRILGALGRGGMGTVYRARHEPSGREVALKVIPEASVGRRLERFRREARNTAALDHPNIIRIHSAGVCDGVAYQVIELVEGGQTLADALHALPREALLRTLRDVARGLGHAHARGVVHRDVKPANILLDPDGRPRVADFGLALGGDDDRLTRTGELVGTPTAMAPEQLKGDRQAIGPPADVWALGVILYEGLTGEPPFPIANLMQLTQAISNGDLRPPRELDPTIGPDLERVCLRCLATQPGERYLDGDALADELDRLLAGAAIAPARRWLPALAGAASVVLVLGAALLAALANRPAPAPTPVVPSPKQAPVGDDDQTRALLARALRDVAFCEQGARRPPLAERRARAQAALEQVLNLTANATLTGAAWLGLARLEDPPQTPSAALEEATRLLPSEHRWLRRIRASRALAAGDATGALAELERAWPRGVGAPREVAWLRGRALWSLGRGDEALPDLERGVGHQVDADRLDLLIEALKGWGRSDETFTLMARSQLLRGAHREDTEKKYQKIRQEEMDSKLTWQEVIDGYNQVVSSDPLHYAARFRLAKTRYVWASDFEGMREAIWVVRDRPAYLLDAWSSIRNMANLVDLVDGGGFARTLRERLVLGEDPDDHLLRGLLAAADLADHDEALRGLERVLDEAPADVVALALRGMVRLRAGQLDGVEEDLSAAWEAEPRCGFALFGLALLEARRERGPTAVWSRLEPLLALDQAPWESEGWRVTFFPELAPYLHEPSFKGLTRER